MSSAMGSTIQRQRILVQGIVQGVGFRPFIYGQATHLGLTGFVFNDSQGVTIEVEGTVEALDHLQRALGEQAPPLARIDSIATELIPARVVRSHRTASRSTTIRATGVSTPNPTPARLARS